MTWKVYISMDANRDPHVHTSEHSIRKTYGKPSSEVDIYVYQCNTQTDMEQWAEFLRRITPRELMDIILDFPVVDMRIVKL